jgi:D-alanyl-D-alanine carboxypeptidase (penicillin-binding protein 5/6)
LVVILGSTSLSLHAQVPVPDAATPMSAPPIPAAPQLGAKSYILVDFNSDRILVENNADLPVEPASIPS